LVSAEDLASSISKVGAVASQTNMSIDELNALTTTLVSSMAISGDEAGTALI
jgi:TP901 family phage tail tape measure protein